MSGIVLRCPNCGTTQGSQGQCDACHEAAVRYFCTNETPGLWLDAPACPRCSAQFGDPSPSRLEKSAPTTSIEVRPPVVRRPPPAPATPDLDPGPWESDYAADPRDASRASGSDPFRLLLGAMVAAARARSERAASPGYDEVAPVRRGGGCVGRIFMLILLLIAAILMAPIFLGTLFGFY